MHQFKRYMIPAKKLKLIDKTYFFKLTLLKIKQKNGIH